MSEHDIVKHGVKTYKIWKAPGKASHKIGEIAIEMLIIVFAVTLSLALERWREHAAEQKAEHDFLEGYRKDLASDIRELREDSATFVRLQVGYDYFANTEKYSPDSINKYIELFYNTTGFVPNSSRYEALKSSGKLDVISNKELLDDIVSLYQEKVEQVRSNTENFTHFKRTQLVPYLDQHLAKNFSNLEAVLHTDEATNYLYRRRGVSSILKSYREVIVLSEKILAEIDQELGKH